MTAKRFTIKEVEIEDYKIDCADAKLVIADNGELIDNVKAVDKLNNLHEENQELKQIIKINTLLEID